MRGPTALAKQSNISDKLDAQLLANQPELAAMDGTERELYLARNNPAGQRSHYARALLESVQKDGLAGDAGKVLESLNLSSKVMDALRGALTKNDARTT